MNDTRFADLHLHSNYSDGTDLPRRVVERAAALGISAIALTDHDSVGGVAEAVAAGAAHGIEILTGVEISAALDETEIHVVGLGIDTSNPAMEEILVRLRHIRARRVDEIVARLERLGIHISLDMPAAQAGLGTLGRLHVARALYHQGYVRTVQQAFDRYIGRGRPAFVPRSALAVPEAIDAIHAAGGVALLAHPGLVRDPQVLRRVLLAPFDGLEAYHIHHSPGQIEEFQRLAGERGWLVGGGSDCHGQAKHRPEMGNVRVPYACVERIREALNRRG